MRVLKTGKFIRLVARGGWEFVERTNAGGVVGIVATTKENGLILVEQHREPVGGRVIELPAGLVGDDGDAAESSAKAGKRELEEEAGYRAGRCSTLVKDGVVSAGLTSETVDLVRAKNVRRVAEGGGVAGEEIEVHVVPMADAAAFLKRKQRAGRRVDFKVYAGLWFCQSEA